MSMMMMDKKKNIVNQIMGPDPREKSEGEKSPSDLESIAQEFVDAVHAKDAAGTAQAFRAMFLECESKPHEEYSEE